MGLAATAAQTVISTTSALQQSKQLKAVAQRQLEDGETQRELLIDNALQNNTRAKKNMQGELAGARLDAAASNLAASGSTHLREVALATRLQDEITNTTDRALQDANLVYEQSLLNSYDTSMSATAAKTSAVTSVLSGAGSIFTGLSSKGKAS